VYQLSTTETRSILRAFADVFKNCSVWTGFGVEWMMAGIREPMKNPGAMDFASQWKDPNVGPEMRALGFKSPEQFGSLFVADGKRLESWIGDALPLTDNFPMRLSITPISMEEKNRSLPVYLDFMDPKASRENFFKSKNMKIIWPETYRKKSSPHFSVRRMINEMSFDQNQIFMNYYRCMNEPLLNGYEYWALRSDNDARNIIDRVMSEREKIDMVQAWPHLAAQAARKREFRTILGYINWALQTLGIENVNLEYHPLRMYLYYLIGENEAAEKAGNLYINLLPAGREERREKIESYRDLIQRQNISTGLKPLPPESLFSGNDLRRSDF
jgi:hypothetical protein